MTATEIRDLLAHLLAGAAGGGTDDEWRARIGNVEVLSLWLNPSCNWKVAPTGSITQVDAILKAAAVVRAEHPYADG